MPGALADVEAGQPVSLAAVVGADPANDAMALREHDADIAVPDLSELHVAS